MYKSTKTQMLVSVTSILLLEVFHFCGTVRAQTRDHTDQRILAPLVSAGIPENDPTALIRTLHSDANLAASAAYALGKLPGHKEAVAALISTIRDVPVSIRPSQDALWDVTAVYAARALVNLREKDWIPVARGRLGLLRDRSSKIQMSEVLASQGCYDGWPVVYDNLLARPYDYVALMAVPSFVGVKHPDGSDVDLAAQLTALIPSMPGDRQELAMSIVSKIRAKMVH
jgi:hypothetical protein